MMVEWEENVPAYNILPQKKILNIQETALMRLTIGMEKLEN